MQCFFITACLAALYANVGALDGIVVLGSVEAGRPFQVTFQNANHDQYRVYLAASLAGSNGPTCYLTNSSTLTSPITLSIPADVGPSASYYSIAIADLTTNQGATFSSHFNLSGAEGTYSAYENHLGGSPFWSADHLPCKAYPCARQCAQASYPADLTENDAYHTMKTCILACDNVTPAANQTAPAHAAATTPSPTPASLSFVAHGPAFGQTALLTLGSSTYTAFETLQTHDGRTITEAVVGTVTLTFGGAPHDINSHPLTLATQGLIIGGTSTVEFSGAVANATTTPNAASLSKQNFAGGCIAALWLTCIIAAAAAAVAT